MEGSAVEARPTPIQRLAEATCSTSDLNVDATMHTLSAKEGGFLLVLRA
jgi:hypothetical protein